MNKLTKSINAFASGSAPGPGPGSREGGGVKARDTKKLLAMAVIKGRAGSEGAEQDTDRVDRAEIERNMGGSEEPSSSDPELWNVDNCEVDMLVKYKMGGQMWYVQSRSRITTLSFPFPSP